MNFGEKLKQLRKDKKISQQALAEMMGVSLPTIRKWEANEKMPKKGEITKLCKKLGCLREDIVSQTKEEQVLTDVKEELKVVPVVPIEEDKEVLEKPQPMVLEEKKEVVVEEKPKKENKEGLLKRDRRKIRAFSQVLIVIASIMRVVIWICIPILLILMFLLPIFFTKVDIHENYIGLTDSGEKITFHEDGDKLWLDINGEKVVINNQLESYAISVVRGFLKNNSTERIVWHLEIILVLTTISLAILYYIFRYIGKFFKNIYSLRLWTSDNHKYLGYCAWLILCLLIIANITNGVFSNLLIVQFVPSVNLLYVILILSLFAMKYVFRYEFDRLDNQEDSTSE